MDFTRYIWLYVCCTYKLGFVGRRGFCDGFEILHSDALHFLQSGTRVQHHVFHKYTNGPQHERYKQVHVDVVSGAV